MLQLGLTAAALAADARIWKKKKSNINDSIFNFKQRNEIYHENS